MTSLHYLNVGAGDCTVIEHDSGRVSMVDICGGNSAREGPLAAFTRRLIENSPNLSNLDAPAPTLLGALSKYALPVTTRAGAFSNLGLPNPPRPGALSSLGLPLPSRPSALMGLGLRSPTPQGDFGMRLERRNPLDYLRDLGIKSVHRFISTHPDMDHLDGLNALCGEFEVANFWHTGVYRPKPDFGLGCRYRESDWNRYQQVVRGTGSTRTLQVRAGDRFSHANASEDGSWGDGIFILSPDDNLVRWAEESDDLNDASYVLLLATSAGNVIIPGDAHDDPWDFVLSNYRPWVENCALLIAPHHGRDSDRDNTFLDVLRPRLTLMGCAPSEHMGYGSWRRRNLKFFTNNQAGAIRVDVYNNLLSVWVENQTFANAAGHDVSIRNANGFTGVGLY